MYYSDGGVIHADGPTGLFDSGEDMAPILETIQSQLTPSGESGDDAEGGRHEIAAGTYPFSSMAKIYGGNTIDGAGPRATEFQAADGYTGEALLKYDPLSDAFFPSLYNLRWDGNHNNATTRGLSVTESNGGAPNDIHIDHHIFHNFVEEGIYITHCWAIAGTISSSKAVVVTGQTQSS